MYKLCLRLFIFSMLLITGMHIGSFSYASLCVEFAVRRTVCCHNNGQGFRLNGTILSLKFQFKELRLSSSAT